MEKVQEYVGPAEIQRMFRVKQTRYLQLLSEPGFPEPVADLEMGRVWRTVDILRWAKDNRPPVDWSWTDLAMPDIEGE